LPPWTLQTARTLLAARGAPSPTACLWPLEGRRLEKCFCGFILRFDNMSISQLEIDNSERAAKSEESELWVRCRPSEGQSISGHCPDPSPKPNVRQLLFSSCNTHPSQPRVLPWCRQSRCWCSNLRKPEQRIQFPLELRQVRGTCVRASHTRRPLVNRRQRCSAHVKLRKLVV